MNSGPAATSDSSATRSAASAASLRGGYSSNEKVGQTGSVSSADAGDPEGLVSPLSNPAIGPPSQSARARGTSGRMPGSALAPVAVKDDSASVTRHRPDVAACYNSARRGRGGRLELGAQPLGDA